MKRKSNTEIPGWASRNGVLLSPHTDTVVTHHNIVGEGSVLAASSQRIQDIVKGKYTVRAVDHAMPNGNREVWVYDPNVNPKDYQLLAQLQHRGRMAGLEIKVINNLRQLPKDRNSILYKPYIRRQDLRFRTSAELHHYGLPPKVTNLLKDKALIHEHLQKKGYAEYTPNFVNCRTKEITKNGLSMVDKIRKMYSVASMQDEYAVGLVIRARDADGGFGSGFVKQLTQPEVIKSSAYPNGKLYPKGAILFFPDGLVELVQEFDSWETALEQVQRFVAENMDMKKSDGVVMSRLIDLTVSPGLMAVVAQGDVYAQFNWNGQYKEPGDTSCTGTTTGNHDNRLVRKYLAQSQRLLFEVVSACLSRERSVESVYAAFNMDLMIVGELERKLHARLQQLGAAGRSYTRDTIGKYNRQYEPRAYDPGKILFAEFNPRDTNWTLAVKAVMQALRTDFTLEEMLQVANGHVVDIVARDKWLLPNGVSTAVARAYFETVYKQLAQSGVGAVVRMPADDSGKMGVIAWNSKGSANEVLEKAHRELPRFAQSMKRKK